MKNVKGRIKIGLFRTYSMLRTLSKLSKIFDNIVESGSHLVDYPDGSEI